MAIKKNNKDPLAGDFTYYQEKEPSELHELHAELVSELTGVEVTAKQVQVILGMHGRIQASEANRKRAMYRERTAESIHRGGMTTAERAALAVQEAEQAAREAAAKAELPSNDNFRVEKMGRKFAVIENATGEPVFTGTKKAAKEHFEGLVTGELELVEV